MKAYIKENFSSTRLSYLWLPLSLIALIFTGLLLCGGNFHSLYTSIQIDTFLNINHSLAQFPNFEWNITQLGDAVVGFSLLSIFFYYAPRLWNALLQASLLSLGASALLKSFFAMPRPASIIPKEDFTIIGRELLFKSLPSGHSMTIFIFITLLAIAFFPHNRAKLTQALWLISSFALGLFIAASRVAVGAHWPLDVLIGSLIGSALAIIGVYLCEKTSHKINYEAKGFDYAGLLCSLILAILLIIKMLKAFLPIYVLALSSLIITIILICRKLSLRRGLDS